MSHLHKFDDLDMYFAILGTLDAAYYSRISLEYFIYFYQLVEGNYFNIVGVFLIFYTKVLSPVEHKTVGELLDMYKGLCEISSLSYHF